MVEQGDMLTEGSINPHDILTHPGRQGRAGLPASARCRTVYRLQGVDINDKHIEVIVRQMLRKVRDRGRGRHRSAARAARGHHPRSSEANDEIRPHRWPARPTCQPSKPASCWASPRPSLATDSFLSAASFQETTRVLTEAAIKGKVDPLLGLKENVIIGKLIPAGTGLPEVEEELVQAEIARDAAEAAYDH